MAGQYANVMQPTTALYFFLPCRNVRRGGFFLGGADSGENFAATATKELAATFGASFAATKKF